ncbi:uncharacterized protein PHALS_02932 [Plasmopara halstedii]|uniref:Uncharacterized protein n=1 Tax=Plasmopara halstedii TaxID=4781 RepID=A0A0P1AZX9_PLAHL|nr:uncharacterized protein PHALS_02932 [Plasmopara halstedii]CEG46532.1 hypothetical protein PHALS_02932 [Plasmopara halstedii]|eukprot:XP_024582901.1 hypothetical protein PHALS_02932 [Plasmopara halstedii]
MRAVAAVSTDDLVNSLLDSVTAGSSSSTPSTNATDLTSIRNSTSPSFNAAFSSTSQSAPSSASSDTESSSSTDAPEVISLITPAPALNDGSLFISDNSEANDLNKSSGNGRGNTGLSIGISLGVLAIMVAALLYFKSRRRHAQKEHESAAVPATGNTPMTVPSDRGFKRERDLGIPEMSIELAPGELGMSKGFDTSYASSSRSSVASQHYNLSLASSCSGLFNTKGGVSPTSSSHKLTSYSYQYRESEEKGSGNNNQSTTGNSTLHLTGLIGNGATASGRGPSNSSRSRKLSAPDEYAELITATNAQAEVNMSVHDQSSQGIYHSLTQSSASQNEMDISMGPDDSFIAPLPPKALSSRVAKRLAVTVGRASEESMGPDSPIIGRTDTVYDTIPTLSGEKMSVSARSSVENMHFMSAASFMSKSSASSASTRDSMTTSACSSAYLPSNSLLQQFSRTTDSDYGEDLTSERVSTESTESANTARSGSLIALNLDAKDSSEIAI